METVRITREELARDLNGYLDKARTGVEVVVQDEHSPAVRLSPATVGRTFAEMLVRAPANSAARMDASFADDVMAGIDAHREPLDASRWD